MAKNIMCTIPPPPPPPPASEMVTPPPEAISESFSPNLDICSWAFKYPELQEACIKNKICLSAPPFRFKYRMFESILQEGPTCGIVALSMAVNGRLSAAEILKLAKSEGFTNNGEMFSCKNMAKLAEKVFSIVEVTDYEMNVVDGKIFNDDLVQKLLDGSILLVPYDADCNHTPCLKQGHKSHWSLVCGIIITQDPGESYTSDPDNVYVLCKHGKSRYLAAWKLKDLEISNSNLVEFLARKGEQLSMYVMPEGGVGGPDGLKDQYLIIDGL